MYLGNFSIVDDMSGPLERGQWQQISWIEQYVFSYGSSVRPLRKGIITLIKIMGNVLKTPVFTSP